MHFFSRIFRALWRIQRPTTPAPSYTLTAREKVNITPPQIPTMICQTNLFLATTFEDKLVYVYINFWYENHTYTQHFFIRKYFWIHTLQILYSYCNIAVFAANTGPKLLLSWNFVLLEKKKKYYLFLKSIMDLDMKSLFFFKHQIRVSIAVRIFFCNCFDSPFYFFNVVKKIE